MKYVLEFGNKSGHHIDNIVLHSLKLGTKLASNLVCVFENNAFACTAQQWVPTHSRVLWESKTHFIALSKLDGKDRGSASSLLWNSKKNFMLKQITHL